MQTSASLADMLREMRERYGSLLKPELIKVSEEHMQQLRSSGIVEAAKQRGDKAPPFALVTGHGEIVTLEGLLAAGPSVITFFRGTWCPYCSAELQALSAVSDKIRMAGASIIAISPQAPTKRDASLEAKIDFPILYDRDNAVGKSYGLVYSFTPALLNLYKAAFQNDISQQNNSQEWELPIPARYVIDTNSVILDARVDPDYRYRPEPQATVDILLQAR